MCAPSALLRSTQTYSIDLKKRIAYNTRYEILCVFLFLSLNQFWWQTMFELIKTYDQSIM